MKRYYLPSHWIYHPTEETVGETTLPDLWEALLDRLAGWRKQEIHFHAFCLMSNHFHFLVTDPLHFFEEALAELLGTELCTYPPKSGEDLTKVPIVTPLHYARTYKYILRNPVAAGAGIGVDNYPYTSIRVDRSLLAPPLFSLDRTIPHDPKTHLDWLNEKHSPWDRYPLPVQLRKYLYPRAYRRE